MSAALTWDQAEGPWPRHLKIVFSEWDERYDEPFLRCLSNLLNLRSQCENLAPGHQQLWTIDMCQCTIHAVPIWMPALSSLTSLCIGLRTLGAGDLQVLGNIPSLCNLKIMQHGTGQMQAAIGGEYPFPCLRQFTFCTEGIMKVVFAPGAMQMLRSLVLRFGQFGDFNFGPENLPSLRFVHVPPGLPPNVVAAFQEALQAHPNNPTLEFN